MNPDIRPNVIIRSKEAPYCYHRLCLVGAGHDRCTVLLHLFYTGLTLARGGMPARFDENPGIFELTIKEANKKMIVRPTFKRSINPLMYEAVESMSNKSGEIVNLAEQGARFEAFVDTPIIIKPLNARQNIILNNSQQMTTSPEDNFDDAFGVSMDDLDLG